MQSGCWYVSNSRCSNGVMGTDFSPYAAIDLTAVQKDAPC